MSVIEKVKSWLTARETPYVLELGSASFRALNGRSDGSAPVIRSFASVAAPQGCVLSNQLDQFVFSSEDLVTSLKSLLKPRKFEEKYVSIVLPDQAFQFGSLMAPANSAKAGLQALLEKEIQKSSTLPFNDYLLRYEFGRKVGNKTPVHYCALPRGIVSDLESLCEEVGLVIVSLQPSFTGLAKLLRQGLPDNGHSSVMVHIGNEAVTAAIYGVDGLKHVQLLNMGGSEFCKALETGLGIDRAEACRMLSEDLILLDDPTAEIQFEIDTYRLLEPVFADFLQKIYGFLLLYTNDHPDDAAFSKIVISGGAARIKNLDRLIAGNLGVETLCISKDLAGQPASQLVTENESFESTAVVLGNLLLEPWNLEHHERTMAA